MNYLVLDVEATTKNTGNPFTDSNKLVAVGVRNPLLKWSCKIEYGDEPYGENLETIQRFVDEAEILVGFNIKYDLHWLRKYGVRFQHKHIWDVQYAHFIENYQETPYPSLNDVYKAHYGKGSLM